MQNEIENIIQSISNKKLSIFCGAGISFHSGLPLANQVTEYILQKCSATAEESQSILTAFPFEAFIEIITEETDINGILKMFEGGKPNTNHKFIARLAKEGYLNNIITTNFDQHIETAFIEIGLIKDVDFSVFSNEIDFEGINWKDDKIKLIKIHGCISNKNEVAITLKLVANKTYSIFKKQVIQKFFSQKINPDVLVLGYSCSDVFDISPEIESLKNELSRVFFIEHISNDSIVKSENLISKEDKNPFTYFINSSRIFANTDNLIKEIWESLFDSEYKFYLYATTDWKINIENWFENVIQENTEGFSHHLLSRVLYHISEFEMAIKHYEKAIFIAQKLDNHKAFSSELGNMGGALNAIGKYEEAKKCLKKSLRVSRAIKNIQSESSQLESLGNVYRNCKEFDLAINFLEMALAINKEYKMQKELGTTLGNLALVYNLTGRYTDTIDCAERGIIISDNLGNKQAEGSQLSSLGIAYFMIGQKEKGLTLSKESIRIAHLLGERKNECFALINLALLLQRDSNFKEAIINATSSLKLAQDLKMYDTEKKAKSIIDDCIKGLTFS
jgi:tetratricopeptide (TPR) repeat protein